MPTAVRDVDAQHLPPELNGLDGYESALVLIRWGGRPVGKMTVPVSGGRVGGALLREEVVRAAAEAIWHLSFNAFLEWDDLDPGPLPTATVAVCTRDRPDDLGRCLAALHKLSTDGQELLVIDSASRGDATRCVVDRHPGIRYVREERPGLNVARNRALREAKHDVVAFTDDDAAPDSAWLRSLVRNFGDPRTLCVTGLTMPMELETEAQEWFERTNGFGRGFARISYDGLRHDPFLAARIGAGVNMALRRRVLNLVGPFDEALDAGTPTRSGGDHDMFTRILSSGYRIIYDPAAMVWHRHRGDWEELRQALYGYGVGVYANLTGHFLRRETRAPMIAIGWLREQIPALARSLLRRPGSIPLDLVLAELRGCAAGPGAYLRSRRAVARHMPTAGRT